MRADNRNRSMADVRIECSMNCSKKPPEGCTDCVRIKLWTVHGLVAPVSAHEAQKIWDICGELCANLTAYSICYDALVEIRARLKNRFPELFYGETADPLPF